MVCLCAISHRPRKKEYSYKKIGILNTYDPFFRYMKRNTVKLSNEDLLRIGEALEYRLLDFDRQIDAAVEDFDDLDLEELEYIDMVIAEADIYEDLIDRVYEQYDGAEVEWDEDWNNLFDLTDDDEVWNLDEIDHMIDPDDWYDDWDEFLADDEEEVEIHGTPV